MSVPRCAVASLTVVMNERAEPKQRVFLLNARDQRGFVESPIEASHSGTPRVTNHVPTAATFTRYNTSRADKRRLFSFIEMLEEEYSNLVT